MFLEIIIQVYRFLHNNTKVTDHLNIKIKN